MKELCRRLGETDLVNRIDSFVALNEGLESKKGKEFIDVSILGFAEGVLVSLARRYPNDERVRSLLENVSRKRAELDATFRKPKPPIFEGT
nr:DUF3216 domain-containing protein [Thermococcus sp. 21S7]